MTEAKIRNMVTAVVMVFLFFFFFVSPASADQRERSGSAEHGVQEGDVSKRNLDVLFDLLGGGSMAAVSPVEESGWIRDRYRIPLHIRILSPHGGDEYLVFVYRAERTFGKTMQVVNTNRYRYLLSPKNLTVVYSLFNYEPISVLGGEVAVAPVDDMVYVYDSKGLYIFSADRPVALENDFLLEFR